jgi:hypothetical protein
MRGYQPLRFGVMCLTPLSGYLLKLALRDTPAGYPPGRDSLSLSVGPATTFYVAHTPGLQAHEHAETGWRGPVPGQIRYSITSVSSASFLPDGTVYTEVAEELAEAAAEALAAYVPRGTRKPAADSP